MSPGNAAALGGKPRASAWVGSGTDSTVTDTRDNDEQDDDGTTAAVIAERFYVGALMHLQTPVRSRALDALDDEALSDVRLSRIRRAISRCDSTRFTAADVVPQMIRDGMPEQLHPIATGLVIDLYAGCPTPEWWPHYASIIRAENLRRQVRFHVEQLARAADTAGGERIADTLRAGASLAPAVERLGVDQ